MEQTNILAVETSGTIGSVAIARGPRLLAQQYFTARLRHASELLPTIELLCHQQNIKPQELNHVYISAGPGSFTGIRIAVTFAKTMAFAWPIKIVAVSSLEALVLNATQVTPLPTPEIHYIAALINAGRGQIFAAVFETTNSNNHNRNNILSGLQPIISPTLTTIRQLLANTPRPLYLIGPALHLYNTETKEDNIYPLNEKYAQPQAAHIHTIGYRMACAGKFTPADKLQPFYMRRPEAEEKWEKLHPNE